MKRAFCDAYQVEVPIVLAGMAFIADPTLVVAVCQAGGLGILGTGPMPPDVLRQQIAEVRAGTDRAFGVNQIVENTPLGPLTREESIEVLAEARISPVVFFWNAPPAAWLERLRQSGSRIWMTVTSLADARSALKTGADALIVQGLEAGGHNRSGASLAELLPPIARLAGAHHVVAAGGIADAASARAALELGADAVCLGTRFVASVESPAHPEWKRRIVKATADDTAITRIFGPEWPDAPMRVLKNRVVDAALRGSPKPEPATVGETRVFGREYAMPSCSALLPTHATTGDLDAMCLAAGTSSERIDRIATAAEIVREIAAGLPR